MEREGMLVWSIYYGRIGSEATERLLERFGHDGSFLLRDSETVQGAYCLCVRQAPFVHTYRLVHSTDGWCLQRLAGFRSQTSEVSDLGNTDRELQKGYSLWCQYNPPHRPSGQNTATVPQPGTRVCLHGNM